MKGIKSSFNISAAAFCWFLIVSDAEAQLDDRQSGEDASEARIEEIIVTATKIERSIHDVPIAMQVYTSDTLNDLNASDFEDYAKYTPGLSFTKVRTGQSNIVIRGLTTGNVTNSQPQNRALVGIYLDDAPVQLTGFNYDVDLFDIARVEVLKGPQGTLFGDSAMAGAIRYVSAAPDDTRFDARLEVSGSSTDGGGDSYSLKAMLNVPLAEHLALRGSAYYVDESGWIDNRRLDEADINSEEIYGGRISALYKPNEAFSAQATVVTKRVNFGGVPETDDQSDLPELTQDREREEGYERTNIANLTLSVETPLGSLTSVTGYIDRDFDFYVSGVMERFMYLVFGEFLPNTRLYYPWKQLYFTEELRLHRTTGDWLDYTIGAFYARQKINYPTYGDDAAYGEGPGFDQYLVDRGFAASVDEVQQVFGCPPDQSVFCGSLDTTQSQKALFADATIAVLQNLDFQVGVRWADWEQDFDENYAGFFNGGPSQKQQTISEDTVNPRFNATYRLNESTNLYFNAGKGFRFGGVNDPLPPTCDAELAQLGVQSPDRFESDSLWTYELGAKSRVSDRVVLNGSVFYTDWDDIQTTRGLTCGFRIIENAGRVVSQGVEIDTIFHLFDGLEITFAGSYTDATLAEASSNLGAAEGDRAPYVPTWKLSAFAFYEFNAGSNWDGFVNAAVAATGKSYTTFSSAAPDRQEIPQMTTVNLSAGIERGSWRVSAFADNLSNERIIYGATFAPAAGAAPQRVTHTYGRPRTVGVEIEYRFR